MHSDCRTESCPMCIKLRIKSGLYRRAHIKASWEAKKEGETVKLTHEIAKFKSQKVNILIYPYDDAEYLLNSQLTI